MHRFDLRRILASPRIYTSFLEFLKLDKARRLLSGAHIRASAGDRLIDIGCGPGNMLPFLPAGVDYWGFDASESYIRHARSRFPGRGRFVQAFLTPGVVDGHEPFDIAIAVGVLHHLDDADARLLFETAFAALKPGGRLVTIDGAYTEAQNPLARLLLKLDRGDHVRTPQAYAVLAGAVFDRLELSLHTDLMILPYTHCIMVCQR